MLLLAGLSLWWVQHPPRTDKGYRDRAVETVESLRSDVETARLWTEQIAKGRVTRGAASIAFEEASSGAQSTASQFEAWIPPAGMGDLRTSVSDAASSVTDTLGRLHVAAERDEWRVVPSMRRDLAALASTLTRLASETRG